MRSASKHTFQYVKFSRLANSIKVTSINLARFLHMLVCSTPIQRAVKSKNYDKNTVQFIPKRTQSLSQHILPWNLRLGWTGCRTAAATKRFFSDSVSNPGLAKNLGKLSVAIRAALLASA
jgi:hypothetical protein